MIRVLRLLEYQYETAEQMEEDMGRWYIPANGVSTRTKPVIRSATLTNFNFPKENEKDG